MAASKRNRSRPRRVPESKPERAELIAAAIRVAIDGALGELRERQSATAATAEATAADLAETRKACEQLHRAVQMLASQLHEYAGRMQRYIQGDIARDAEREALRRDLEAGPWGHIAKDFAQIQPPRK